MNAKHLLLALTATAITTLSHAHSLESPRAADKNAAFDITSASISSDGRLATFMMEVAGSAGSDIPQPIGQLTGATAHAYAWPTKLDPAIAGFDSGSGILALAVTAHPDFDDTPLFDENADGDPNNDGKSWHSHWVVLVEDSACPAGLKVRDVAPGQDLLPATAPGLPIALDSPGMSPILNGHQTRITVPLKDAIGVNFDAVTAVLQVNQEGAAPLLCLTQVHDIASGDLSMPGHIIRQPANNP
ncbi:MAG: hypothetical protein Tsb002_19230 [Wenzhouxiangellaceae bacterium]